MLSYQFSIVARAACVCLSLAITLPASAQALKEQLVGSWTVESNIEEYTDGKKASWDPSLKGTLFMDAGGRFALMMAEVGNRKKAEGNPAMNPVGKMISYFGSYTVNDADKTLTFNIVGSSFPNWDGSEQKRVASLNGSTLVLKAASPIPSPQGPFVPVVTWKKN
jgi:hypothetical protein